MFGNLSRPKINVFSFENSKGIRAMTFDSVKTQMNLFRKRAVSG